MIIHRTGIQDFPDKIKMLVAGQPGTGKTRFAATFPNPIFANAWGGMASIADRSLPYVNLSSEANALQLKMLLEGTPEEREARFGFPVDTLVIDTIDEFQRVLLAERLVHEKRAETNAGDYGWLGQRMHTIFEGFVSLDINFVVIAHLKDVTDAESGRLFIKPGLAGGFADQMHQYFTHSVLLSPHYTRTVQAAPLVVNGLELSNVAPLDLSQGACYLVSKPDSIYEWLRDLSGTLPDELELNFENDYDTIRELVDSKRETFGEPEEPVEIIPPEAVEKKVRRRKGGVDTMIKDTVAKVSEKKAVEEVMSAPATDTKCTDCDNMVESEDQLDLSMIRFREPLCSADFAKRRANS